MDDNKNKLNSELSETGADTAADKRFDVLDHIDLDDLSADSRSGDADEFLEDIFGTNTSKMGAGKDKKRNSGAYQNGKMTAEAASEPTVLPDPSAFSDTASVKASMSETGTIEIAKKSSPGKASAAGTNPGAKPGAASGGKVGAVSMAQVKKLASTVTALLEGGKLSSAIDIVLSLRGANRTALRENVSVTIPLGSRDSDLRRISAGALIQSYLDNGKIVRRDIEDKLYAIIESSEPEYDDDDEIIEQTPADILYKVTACMAFVAELTERSGNHPDEKNAMYAAGDSVLDQFMADNMAEVQKKNKKRLAVLSEAIKASGGQVAQKFAYYYEASKKSAQSPVMSFIGDALAFRVALGVISVLCLLTLGFYIFTKSPLLTFVAKDSAIMIFVIMAEVFFMIGMALLCVIIGFGGRMRALKKTGKKSK